MNNELYKHILQIMTIYRQRLALLCILTLFFTACTSKHYVVSTVEGSWALMDSSWDRRVDPAFSQLILSYKQQLEAEMNQVIGEAAQPMQNGFPQSLLTNLTSDALKQFGETTTGQPFDFAVTNVHGHRSSLNRGPITIGNMFEIYSFDNLVVMLELDGKAVRELFEYYAWRGGEGLSTGVELVIHDGKIASLEVGGKPVDEQRIYKVVTLDYLAEGNDGMTAFQQAKSLQNTGITLRDVMIDYVKQCTAAGKKVDSVLDNRIIIEK
jgi:2',3'-cyclic-nucleotide 2'-phosphodiesterase (5'-nucleotidase family)